MSATAQAQAEATKAAQRAGIEHAKATSPANISRLNPWASISASVAPCASLASSPSARRSSRVMSHSPHAANTASAPAGSSLIR
jgi:hypothetical protein